MISASRLTPAAVDARPEVIPADPRARFLSRHRNGAKVRSTASSLSFLLAIPTAWAGVLPSASFLGVTAAVFVLLLVSFPALKVAEHLPSRFFNLFSVLVHVGELLAYTAIIHFSGGAEATFLTGTYAAMIAYVGVVMPRPWPFRFALAASFAYALMVVFELTGVLAHRPLVPHLHFPLVLQIVHVGFTVAILMAVAYLASQGADLIRKTQQRLKEQNLALESATERAIQSDRLKSEFLANMSHEIRTPLNGVIGMTSLLLGASLLPEQKGQVETIRASGVALLDVISDVLDLSKVESGVIELDQEPFPVRTCFEEAVAIMAGAAAAKNLDLSLSFDDRVPVSLSGDHARVRQIAVNLLGNAVKFTDSGAVSIRVAASADGDWFRLSATVADTGPGIADDAATRLFRPFVQLDSSSTRRFGGTGLGLVISRRLARLMGGDVVYEPRSGGGSIFHFTALLRPGVLKRRTLELEAAVTAARAALEQGTPRPSLRALVVDDNAVNRQVASMMLKRLGHVADSAGDGVEALEALDRGQYDIVLMDVQMPNMDGIEATRKIRARPAPRNFPDLWILGVSAHTLSTDRDQCLAAGMNDYLTKPFQLADLEAAILRAIVGVGESGTKSLN